MFIKGYISGIYRITCSSTGKFYIGSAINLKRRFEFHLSRLKNGNHINTYLQNSWNKYGKENFKFEIIEIVYDIKKLSIKEQLWLDQTKCYNSNIGFNISKNTITPMLGRNHTRATKEKISNSKKGTRLTKEHKLKLSIALKGRHRPSLVKEKIRKAQIGIPKPQSSQPGSKHGAATINEKTAIDIIRDHKKGLSYKELVIKYGASYKTIWLLTHKITWKHIKE
jgi:group I intron endonuclease